MGRGWRSRSQQREESSPRGARAAVERSTSKPPHLFHQSSDPISCFVMQVERLQPDHWVVNQVYLAKCEYSRCCYAEAVRWILSAERLLTSENASTLGDAADKDTLVTEIGSLRPQYEAYL